MGSCTAASRRSRPTPHVRSTRVPVAATSDDAEAILEAVRQDGDQYFAALRALKDPGRVMLRIARTPTFIAGKQMHYRLKNDVFDFEKRACVAAESTPDFAALPFSAKAEIYRRATAIGRALEKRLEEHVERVLIWTARRRARHGIVDLTVEWLGYRSVGTSPSHREREQAATIIRAEQPLRPTATADDTSNASNAVQETTASPRENSGPPPPELPADDAPTGARRTRRSGTETVLRSATRRLLAGAGLPTAPAEVIA